MRLQTCDVFRTGIPEKINGNGMAVCGVHRAPMRPALNAGVRQSGIRPKIFGRLARNLAYLRFSNTNAAPISGLINSPIFLRVFVSVPEARSYILVTLPTHDCNIGHA
jgi:hypothetical protein